MEKIKTFFSNKLYLGLTVGIVALLAAALAVVLIVTAPPADLTDCTVEVKSEGGKE